MTDEPNTPSPEGEENDKKSEIAPVPLILGGQGRKAIFESLDKRLDATKPHNEGSVMDLNVADLEQDKLKFYKSKISTWWYNLKGPTKVAVGTAALLALLGAGYMGPGGGYDRHVKNNQYVKLWKEKFFGEEKKTTTLGTSLIIAKTQKEEAENMKKKAEAEKILAEKRSEELLRDLEESRKRIREEQASGPSAAELLKYCNPNTLYDVAFKTGKGVDGFFIEAKIVKTDGPVDTLKNPYNLAYCGARLNILNRLESTGLAKLLDSRELEGYRADKITKFTIKRREIKLEIDGKAVPSRYIDDEAALKEFRSHYTTRK